MKKTSFLPTILGGVRVTGLAAWQTGRLFRQLAARALDAVQEVLRAEIEKGNLKLVADFLADKALPAARVLLIEQMTVRLLLRLGLRGALASNVVGWVLPFVIERLISVGRKSGFFDKLMATPTVSNSLERLEELRHATWQLLVPSSSSSAKVVDAEPDDAKTPRLPLLVGAKALKIPRTKQEAPIDVPKQA